MREPTQLGLPPIPSASLAPTLPAAPATACAANRLTRAPPGRPAPGQVLKTRSAATLDPLLAASGACNGAFWLAYGLALRDPYVSAPNGVGAALNVLNLAAVAAFGRGPPRK
jgi:hypothetical protein